jgi:hypothetical protein
MVQHDHYTIYTAGTSRLAGPRYTTSRRRREWEGGRSTPTPTHACRQTEGHVPLEKAQQPTAKSERHGPSGPVLLDNSQRNTNIMQQPAALPVSTLKDDGRAGLNKYCARACSTLVQRRTGRTHAGRCATGLQRRRVFLLANARTALQSAELGLHEVQKPPPLPPPRLAERTDAGSSSRSLQADGGARWGYVNHITSSTLPKKKLVLSNVDCSCSGNCR